MKKLSLILNVILFVLVGVLFYLHFSFVKQQQTLQPKVDNASTERPLKISYVNLDSLEAHYTYFLEKKKELDQKQQNVQKKLTARSNEIQRDIQNLQKKAPTLTQSQGEAEQKKIMKKRQQLQVQEQQLRTELMQEQDQFNKGLHDRLNSFMIRYNTGKNYDYILSYSGVMSQILYKNKALDITNEVIRGLNNENSPSVK